MGKEAKGFEFKKFATPRIIGGIAIVVIVLWALSIIIGPSEGLSPRHQTAGHDSPAATAHQATDSSGHAARTEEEATGSHGARAVPEAESSHAAATQAAPAAQGHGSDTHGEAVVHETADSHAAQATASHDPAAASQDHAAAGQPQAHPQPATTDTHGVSPGSSAAETAAARQGAAAGHPIAAPPVHKPMPKGVAFVQATIQPLGFELEERWWGWRPNDIIDVTDNVNNFQMGVLEVTRRTTVALAERISRTGTTDAFDENLEQAMNWFMVKATSYWFPSAESKYEEGLEELGAYLEKLKEGKATFYTRTDNLIPLLASFEDLLGSCDENLVKQVNEDGTPVSFFAVDDYFYYTQGVASAMASVLEAVHHDFLLTLESRNGTELLHHAIVACQRAGDIDPWIILDRNLSSVFANHRANMAAPISHARFYIGQLIKTLST